MKMKKTMPKVLYVHHGKGIGGAPMSLLYTILGVKDEFAPSVFFLHGGEVVKKFQKHGIATYVDNKVLDLSHTEVSNYSLFNPLFWIRLLYQPISLIRFYLFLRQNNAVIVHLNTSSLITLAAAAKLAGKKVVLHVREPIAAGSFGLRQAALRELIFRLADAVIPISDFDASRLKASEKIKVVHNFVDFDTFDKGKKCDAFKGLKGKRKMVLFLGGVSKLKGTHVLVESLKYVKRKFNNFVCVIAGEDKDRTGFMKWKMRKEIADNKLEGSVTFLGPVHDVPQLIACCDLLVFPSTKPHFARPIIEASAMAKPVIASDLGGPRELVLPGKTGLLVKAGDAASLGNAIAKILSNQPLSDKMGEAGYQFAFEKFEQTKNTRQIKRVYQQLLNS